MASKVVPSPGVYVVRVGDASCMLGAWMQHTAPQSAVNSALLVAGPAIDGLPAATNPRVVRGQGTQCHRNAERSASRSEIVAVQFVLVAQIELPFKDDRM